MLVSDQDASRQLAVFLAAVSEVIVGPGSGHSSPAGALSRSISPSDLSSSAESLADAEHDDAFDPSDSGLAEGSGVDGEGPPRAERHPAATSGASRPDDGLAARMQRPSTPERELGTEAIFDQDSAKTSGTHSEVRSASL